MKRALLIVCLIGAARGLWGQDVERPESLNPPEEVSVFEFLLEQTEVAIEQNKACQLELQDQFDELTDQKRTLEALIEAQ